jgi:hypothetical protein
MRDSCNSTARNSLADGEAEAQYPRSWVAFARVHGDELDSFWILKHSRRGIRTFERIQSFHTWLFFHNDCAIAAQIKNGVLVRS